MRPMMKPFTTILSVALLAACANDGSMSGSGVSSLTMQLSNSAPSQKAILAGVGISNAPADPLVFGDDTTSFTITEARMHIRNIKFDTSTDDLVPGETYTVPGPYVMDLLTKNALPENPVFDLPTGNYQRVDIRLDEANIEDAILADTDELLTNALIVKGTHNYNNVTDGTFTLTVKVTEDIRFEPVGGIIVDTDTGADVTLTYSVTDWLEDPQNPGTKIDLTTCITNLALMDGANHIAIDENTDCNGNSIGGVIKDNMKNKYDMSSS